MRGSMRSTLTPYYVIYQKVFVAIPGTARRDPADDAPTDRYARHALSFELTAEEELYARVLSSPDGAEAPWRAAAQRSAVGLGAVLPAAPLLPCGPRCGYA
jgi:hypothetical protein